MNRKQRRAILAHSINGGFRFDGETLEIQAAGAEKTVPTFTMVAYSGGPLRVKNYAHPVYVDLSGIEKNKDGVQAYLLHDESKIVGQIPTVDITTGISGQVRVAGNISGTGAAAQEVIGNHKNGYVWRASIGATPIGQPEFIPAGRPASVNGRQIVGPALIARRSVLNEVSFVGIGADTGNTHVSIAATHKETAMTYEQYLASLNLDPKTISAALDTTLRAAFADLDTDDQAGKDAQAKAAADKAAADAKAAKIAASADTDPLPTAADTVAEVRAAHAGELKRIASVGKIAAKHPDIAAKAIEGGWDDNKTELEVMRADRAPAGGNGGQFFANTGAGGDITASAFNAAAAISAGVSEKNALEGLDAKTQSIATQRRLRGMSFHQMIAQVAATYGIHVTPGRLNEGDIKAVLAHEARNLDIQAADGFSTMSLSGITENIMNKLMLQAYGSVPSVIPMIAYETDTNDFKIFKRYRLSVSGDFEIVGPTGELAAISAQDESYPNQLRTRGGVMTIGRELLLNDDMGAIAELPTSLGLKAVKNREKAFFTTFLLGLSTAAPNQAFNFWSAGAKNYLSGAGSALSISSVTTAVQKQMEQKDANGDPVMILPSRLLTCPANKATADNLFSATNIIATALGSTSAAAVTTDRNPHAGRYSPVVTPFLGTNSGVTGGADTQWALLPDPAGGQAPVQIGYLRGQRTPIVERGTPDFNTLGIAMRLIFDFGIALHDFRCGVYSAGA